MSLRRLNASTLSRRLVVNFYALPTRADSSLPDLHALPSRIGALRKAIGALAIDAAQVVREDKVLILRSTSVQCEMLVEYSC